jgi:hypothetical protein
MIHSLVGPLPKHRYVYVQPNAIGEHGWLPAIWFGLVSHPSRTWGCNLMLESGAIYRNVPLHHLASMPDAEEVWLPGHAQVWDCYGYNFTILEYPMFFEMEVVARIGLREGRSPYVSNTKEYPGSYLFTVAPIGDGWSIYPEQTKEFTFVELDNGRFSALPTNAVLMNDKSFVVDLNWPKFLKRQTEVWSAE